MPVSAALYVEWKLRKQANTDRNGPASGHLHNYRSIAVRQEGIMEWCILGNLQSRAELHQSKGNSDIMDVHKSQIVLDIPGWFMTLTFGKLVQTSPAGQGQFHLLQESQSTLTLWEILDSLESILGFASSTSGSITLSQVQQIQQDSVRILFGSVEDLMCS